MSNSSFGAHLRKIRRAHGIGQRTLASLVDVDFTYISKIECGHMPPPSEEVVEKLVLILEDEELYLLAGKIPKRLRVLAQDNSFLIELLIVLSEKTLPDEIYQQMISLCKDQ